jgi:hypothetical protein
MNRSLFATLLGAELLFSVGCKAKPDEKEALRLGVVRHLAAVQGLNMPNMEIKLTQFSVNGDQATAQVEIHAKGAEAASGSMQLAYSLEKRGDEWIVVKSAAAGGSLQHPAPGEMPPGAGLPAGHPSVNGNAGQVHPDFNEILKGAPAAAPPQVPPAPATQAPAKP